MGRLWWWRLHLTSLIAPNFGEAITSPKGSFGRDLRDRRVGRPVRAFHFTPT
jgi:hypothetical protein